MAEIQIRPLLAHVPERTPPWNWRLFFLPVLLAVLGIVLATVFAVQGQQASRKLAGAELEYRRVYYENLLHQEEARAENWAKIEEYRRELADARHAGVASYLRPGRHFTHWDGYRYEEIIDGGYVYRPDPAGAPEPVIDWPTADGGTERRLKNVVWYPLYPLLGATVQAIGTYVVYPVLRLFADVGPKMPTHHALTLVSQLCAIGAAVVFFALARRHYFNRMPALDKQSDEHVTRRWDLGPADTAALWAVAFLIFGPAAVFLYANYTESLFVLLLALFLFCIQGRWWWLAAVVAAVASASRSQGVLFGPILAVTYLLRGDIKNLLTRAAVAGVLGMVSAIGVLGFMAFLWVEFGDPLAFMKAQAAWNVGINGATLSYAVNPVNPMTHFLKYLLTLPTDLPRLFEAFCVIAPPVLLMLLGARFLSFEQELIGWTLWALPYVSNSLAGNPPGNAQWMSMGRFMAVALPLQIILGAVLVRFRWAGPAMLAVSASLFGLFAFLFGWGQWVG